MILPQFWQLSQCVFIYAEGLRCPLHSPLSPMEAQVYLIVQSVYTKYEVIEYYAMWYYWG